ncbi:protein of unknown function DUF262 [Pirellula staleyi DSM 6068]|uniref:DUF262 domain-containing protein n=1 Tax=Pirellula staleyi (strain ATCC 27377 / DSM 6068 / ICPB 4128) TaxID=530564 RepID=D2QXG5_PIRSD|nr:DUF262 domain-containing protein [Pirellula staleyi]ADB16150.1 protein of unknown function DUF262 [Pirellula staleyi DSM 6068]
MATIDGIQISREGIGHAIADNYLAVPVYQRSYAWEESHVEDLFHDLATAIANSESEYFLGSIVVTNDPNGIPEVVDGQQRLATTIVLLAAIRDYFSNNKDQKRADGIEHKFLMSTDLRSQEIVPRMKLNETDNDYFKSRVLLKPDDPVRKEHQKAIPNKDSHRKLHAAAKIAAQQVNNIVKQYKESDRGDRLIDWVDYLCEKARVIWVTVPDHSNAFVIFETLNDRGLELSISDLLKNYLFGRSGDRIKEVQQRWASMTGALETVSSEGISVLYIKHLWASMYGPVREKHLYTKIREQVKNKQGAIDLATNLSENATCYAAILNPSHELWNSYGTSARKHVETLRSLRAEQLRPLVLAVVKSFSENEAKKALKLFVCWAVRFLIVGGHGGGVMEKAYAERALEVRNDSIKNTKQLAKAMLEVIPSDAAFESAFASARVSQANLARYYLRAIELKKRKVAEPELVPNSEEEVINLEHVLPATPQTKWKGFTPEIADAYYKRIGNLCLLKATANSLIGNSPFSQKVKVYAQSEFELTSSISKNNEWTVDTIAKRQLELAKLAVETWPIVVK